MAGRYAELTKPFQVMDMQKYVNSTKIAPCTLESVSPVSSTLMHTHHRHERARGPFLMALGLVCPSLRHPTKDHSDDTTVELEDPANEQLLEI